MNWSFEITKQVLAAVVRWALATLGTFLVTKGIVDPTLADAFISEWTGIVVGVVLVLIAFVWKWLNARYNVLAILTAVEVQAPIRANQIPAAVEKVKGEVQRNPLKTLPY